MSLRVQEYIDEVMAGRVLVCKWVRLAVERHVRDLENGHERSLRFDEGRARVALAFFSLLKHSKGEWAGRVVVLEPWQQFILWVVFGWCKLDPETGEWLRRFNTAYQEVARKNGKTTIASGVGLYLLAGDGEPGAEVYTAATKRDQAKIAHGEATRMVKASAQLKKYIRIFRDNLHVLDTASKFEPLGADADTLDGLNVHGIVADEIHAWPNRELWDVLETATGSRRNPLMWAITTAGSGLEGLYADLHEYTEKVLKGIIQDDSFFGIIFTLDPDVRDGEGNIVEKGDDWEDESTWIKANPNLGISKKMADMRRKAERAKSMPSALNAFLRLELNVITQGVTKWMNMAHWDLCGQAVDASGLEGRSCYVGLDLSSTLDITARLLVFPPEVEGDLFAVLCRFYVPEDAIEQRAKQDRVPYPVWVRQGFLVATPGNVVDYDFVVDELGDDMGLFDVRELAFDRWGSQKIITDLQNKLGFTVDEKVHEMSGDPLLVQFGQGFASMSPPMKELERLVLKHLLAHGNHPVLRWMADNVVARVDPAGNIKPDKEKSREKIDGITALIMALSRALLHTGEGSVYEDRGVRLL